MSLLRLEHAAIVRRSSWFIAIILASHSGGETLAQDSAAATPSGTETTVTRNQPARPSAREREL
jgi:hypothetical protein